MKVNHGDQLAASMAAPNGHGVSFPADFNADMRFMTGRYVDLPGVTREGTFGFF